MKILIFFKREFFFFLYFTSGNFMIIEWTLLLVVFFKLCNDTLQILWGSFLNFGLWGVIDGHFKSSSSYYYSFNCPAIWCGS